MPKGLQLIIKTGYDWEERKKRMTFYKGISIQNVPVVNPSLMNEFFGQYKLIENQENMTHVPGWIEQNKGQNLIINVTRHLSEEQWARIADECERYNVNLQIHYDSSIQLPEILMSHSEIIHPVIKSSCEIKIPEHTSHIISSDLDVTIIQKISSEDDSYVIDISECSASDLLGKIEGGWDKKKQTFHFKKSKNILDDLLTSNKKVILKGTFSPELADALQPYILQRAANQESRGQLILLSPMDHKNPFNYLSGKLHNVTLKEKLYYLKQTSTSSKKVELNHKEIELDRKETIESDIKEVATLDQKEIIELTEEEQKKPFCQLKTIQAYTNQGIQQNPWNGMEALSRLTLEDERINYNDSKTNAELFTHKRIVSVNNILSIMPYVFLSGLTGVGKSTFVQKDFLAHIRNQKPAGRLYQGESDIKNWAVDTDSGKKILFIDEANLSSHQWSEFEGLYQTPPRLFINGEYFTLTEDHKVIFAGNPVSYGDERKLSPFFKRHGNAIVFDPLPPEYIYEYILKPVLGNTLPSKLFLPISVCLLKMYRFLLQCSTQEVLISPRELQMIALLIIQDINNYKLNEENEIKNVIASTKYNVYLIGKTLVPDQFQQSFDNEFKHPCPFESKKEEKLGESDFLITPSRVSTLQLLTNLFTLREWRQENKESLTEEQLYGGMGGLILEGTSAAGKSELVIAALRARGYVEMKPETPSTPTSVLTTISILPSLQSSPSPILPLVQSSTSTCEPTDPPQKIFYRIPVSMSLNEKKALLLKAFHQGAIVLIDEINSSPMLEQLLNALAMGRTLEGQRPNKPGFLIIGTQNPITMLGRRAPSTAFSRRFIKEIVPDYSAEELQNILISKGTYPSQASRLVEIYHKQLKRALEEHLSPVPTFRDVIKLAEKHNANLKIKKTEMIEKYEKEPFKKLPPAKLINTWILSNPLLENQKKDLASVDKSVINKKGYDK